MSNKDKTKSRARCSQIILFSTFFPDDNTNEKKKNCNNKKISQQHKIANSFTVFNNSQSLSSVLYAVCLLVHLFFIFNDNKLCNVLHFCTRLKIFFFVSLWNTFFLPSCYGKILFIVFESNVRSFDCRTNIVLAQASSQQTLKLHNNNDRHPYPPIHA